MLIYPAVDIKNGKCVRLTQGFFCQEKIYGEDPVEAARMWQEKGAKRLHVVDLDGAMEGEIKNGTVIQKLVQSVKIPVQVGGGIRSIEAIENLLAMGIERVILGTKALHDKTMLQQAVGRYPDKVVVSIDAKDGLVAVEGWTKTSGITVMDCIREVEGMGVATVIYTDISRDGTLTGPNFEEICHLKSRMNIPLIASGGVGTLGDLVKLKEIGIEGVIVGKALYERKVDLRQVEEAL